MLTSVWQNPDLRGSRKTLDQMAERYAELEEPLFFDEPPGIRTRAVQDTTDLDALLAFEAESPRSERTAPAHHGSGVKFSSAGPSGSILFVESSRAQNRLPARLALALILIGVAVGFGLVLTLLG